MGSIIYIAMLAALVLGLGLTVLMYLVKALEGLGLPLPVTFAVRLAGGLGLIGYFLYSMFRHFAA